jgi:hypothetical protein
LLLSIALASSDHVAAANGGRLLSHFWQVFSSILRSFLAYNFAFFRCFLLLNTLDAVLLIAAIYTLLLAMRWLSCSGTFDFVCLFTSFSALQGFFLCSFYACFHELIG